MNTKILLGKLVATPNALAQVPVPEICHALARHQSGDWGELSEDDRAANDKALANGGRLVSAYNTIAMVRFWIITEWDRSITTVLLPEDY
jgi:hypothetical protein